MKPEVNVSCTFTGDVGNTDKKIDPSDGASGGKVCVKICFRNPANTQKDWEFYSLSDTSTAVLEKQKRAALSETVELLSKLSRELS